MAKIANKGCRYYVEKRKAFEGYSMWSTWHIESTGKHYVVYSYGNHFPMYIYDDGTAQWFGNKDKFSRTTSKHQSQVRPTGVDITWLPLEEMKTLAVVGYTELVKRRLGATA